MAKRRYYIDEDSWYALLGEGYDADGNMTKGYAIYNGCMPSVPSTAEQGTAVYQLQTGDYAWNGCQTYRPYTDNKFEEPQSPNIFSPAQMAASASF